MEIPTDQIYDSLRKSAKLPYGWKPDPQSIRKVRVKNLPILNALREHYPGEWRKVYQRGVDGTEVHYFEHRQTGKVWGIKLK